MSGKVSLLDERVFEEWIIRNYPDLFVKWENEYSEYMDIDCWIHDAHSMIFREWQHYHNLFPLRKAK